MSAISNAIASALALCLLSGAVSAQTYSVGSLKIEMPWIRATPGGAKVAGGFMVITNTGTETDRLVGGVLPQAGRVEVHEMKMEGDVMQMRQLSNGLEIAPGQKIELKPGSFHVMFMELREPLKQGEKLKGKIQFQKAGAVEIEYRVEGIGAQGAPAHNH